MGEEKNGMVKLHIIIKNNCKEHKAPEQLDLGF